MNIDGKLISQKRKDALKIKIDELKAQGSRLPKLTVVLVGENPASQTYVRNKDRACAYVGMLSDIIRLEEQTSEEKLIQVIESLNQDESVDGILVQLPLPAHIDEDKILNLIDPTKDVDGFHPLNVAKLVLGEKGLVPCTPQGMMVLLDEINYDLTGKEVVVVGRSNIVGKPVALLCLHKHATVTIAHSRTKNLPELCKRGDVLIAAIGRPRFFNKDYIKPGAVVLDVGINRDENNKLCGDVDYEDVKDIASYITPVPGGVGPMTIAMLMENTYQAYLQREAQKNGI
ncbi:bifunctional methylenetetrahydrofolate dehydrogenase/methenyltetrahydrofolate cyclohydrolase FolD [Allocoprobacillus halotolerans]|uniref:Bifunctional protein FolD n=1 Tax=Allocoprobacillus halotolerans TaxID=2944914 RepID=A0ABY5I853_9FIRM|nr:bifunctional methylenetetrahydrofolate dehydrogenase/methenyltetrahydrofolate cyclohydrolase FolD [Allocoprobacillus halotolerans]UTY40213.1 bifunctional methylenetetrahydrofolate dehydrogenase/methenyltetrahydrofolate cyclohydrolase FolD [Allocoprobacillus halotolerans]